MYLIDKSTGFQGKYAANNVFFKIIKNANKGPGMVVDTFNPYTKKAEAGSSLSSRLELELHSEFQAKEKVISKQQQQQRANSPLINMMKCRINYYIGLFHTSKKKKFFKTQSHYVDLAMQTRLNIFRPQDSQLL